MATDITPPPVHQPIVQKNGMLTPEWELWHLNIYETLREYVSTSGVQLPALSTDDIAAIATPPDGLLIQNKTTGEPQVMLSGAAKNISYTTPP